MLQYKIPQNVQLEDKIVSFLTIRQLIICAIGGGIAYVLYITLAPNYYGEVWMPPVFLISALTLAIAFVKINDIPFIKWVLLLIEFFARPRKRVWDKSANTSLLFAFVGSKRSVEADKQKRVAEEKDNIKNEKDFSALEEITKKLDQNPFKDIEDKKDRIDDSDDHKLAHSALMSNEDIDSHEKRIKAIMAMQQSRKENAKLSTAKKEAQSLRPTNIGVFSEKENAKPPEVKIKKELPKEETENSQNLKFKDDLGNKEDEQEREAENMQNIRAKNDLGNKIDEQAKVVVQNKAELVENVNNSQKNEALKQSTENITQNTKDISKDDFLKNKKKKLSRKAFPLPVFKKEIIDNNTEKIKISNIQPDQIDSPQESVIKIQEEKAATSSIQSNQPKRFSPVREKTHVDTRVKPVLPKEHEIMLDQIKEGEVQINFSNNNE